MKHTGLTTALLLVLLCLISSAASASTWYVNGVSGSDSNDCKSPTTACKTIRHAIALASSGDSIKVAAAIYTENLIINISLRVVGSGAGTTIVDGGGVARVVTISNASAHVTLSGMTISNGHAYSGGGIQNSGTLALTETRVTGNSVTTAGGGLWNGGTLTISSSTVSGNQAIKVSCTSGSCVVHGGGIHNASIGRLTIKNSTISGNYAGPGALNTTGKGGGIFTLGTLTISNSTVSGNDAAFRVCTRCIPPRPYHWAAASTTLALAAWRTAPLAGIAQARAAVSSFRPRAG